MKTENNLLMIACLVIFIIFIFHKPVSTESFLNACQYYQIPETKYGETLELTEQHGRPGIDVEKEKLYPDKYRAAWIRYPEPRYKYECTIDKHLNRRCKWTPIYTTFYPDLRGEQTNMMLP